jgi:hypothetical protein
MDMKDKKFDEQDHPLKNTDHAFVQVGKNGEPVIPKVEEPRHDVEEGGDPNTTIGHR